MKVFFGKLKAWFPVAWEKIKKFVKAYYEPLLVVAGILVFMGGYKFVNNVIIPRNAYYVYAQNAYETGDYEHAILGYLNSQWWRSGTKKAYEVLYEHPEGAMLMRDDISFNFGRYEQDNKKRNGPEDIDWYVYEKDGKKLLLVSKYALDVKPFNDTFEEVTWETSSLRKWLNEDFLNTAFTPEEIEKIMVTDLAADSNHLYGTSGGNDTEDKVFIFNYTEYNSYPPLDITLSAYALSKGAFFSNALGCLAWLRTPSQISSSFEYVCGNGDYSDAAAELGLKVNESVVCVRPAIWVDFSK